jgi:hypothetical protein
MSHAIIKHISVNHKTNEVHITSCSNNVYPHKTAKFHCQSLTDFYKENGLAALEKEILYNFMCGNFQKGTSDYNNSLKAYGCPKSGNESVDYGYDRDQAYVNLLLYRAEKSVKVKVKVGNNYITRITPRRAWHNSNATDAKIFSLAEFNIIKKRFSGYEITAIPA